MRPRSHERTPVQRRVWLLDHLGRQRHWCVMSDISEGGARLELPPGTDPPQMFVLALTEDGSLRRTCEVRWRRDGAIGVRFVDPADPSRDQPGPVVRAEWV
jgi:hypothetical protein